LGSGPVLRPVKPRDSVMFFISWSGFGFITIVFGFGGGVIGALVSDLIQGGTGHNNLTDTLLIGAGMLAGAVANWVFGRRMNGRAGRVLIDPATGQRVILRRRHTLFWIPMQWWSIPMALLAGLIACLPPT
jgi:hypothetical protein